jgi:uncharacterized protein (DUF1015 family)
VPYDVVTTEEARRLAARNPLSFLRVSRAEIELPEGTDPHSAAVYRRAAQNFASLRRSLVLEDAPSIYLYRLQTGEHQQTGIAACFSLDEYDRGIIRKHERTRRDKEDDRTQHMLALGAQTGPVFLVYRSQPEITRVVRKATASEPLFDFEAVDGVRHTLWRADDASRDLLVVAAHGIPAMYIADGHHRAASAARARDELKQAADDRTDDASTFLAVAFAHDDVRILAYNRAVADLGPYNAGAFLESVRERFHVQEGGPIPARAGDIAMYLEGVWYTLRRKGLPADAGRIAALDVSILQDQLLAPILKIADVRSDPRISFVGGGRGAAELQRLVDSREAAVAFSLYPVSVDDLMAVSDAGDIMPPKSTWFEPKLRDGLLIHLI